MELKPSEAAKVPSQTSDAQFFTTLIKEPLGADLNEVPHVLINPTFTNGFFSWTNMSILYDLFHGVPDFLHSIARHGCELFILCLIR